MLNALEREQKDRAREDDALNQGMTEHFPDEADDTVATMNTGDGGSPVSRPRTGDSRPRSRSAFCRPFMLSFHFSSFLFPPPPPLPTIPSLQSGSVSDQTPTITHGYTVDPQDGLLFTLTTVSPNLKTTVFPDFFESEQGTNYVNGLSEEPRDT